MNPVFAYLHHKSRRKKFELFRELLQPSPDARILNVGATGIQTGLADQFESFYPHSGQVTGGGLSLSEVADYFRSFPVTKPVVFDGCRLPFGDDSFDIVYSNAVIEHLPNPESQRSFASEVRRVGRGWFVTTPNLWFPVEPHYHLPLVQFLSEPRQRRLVRKLGKTPYESLRLLSRREMQQLFPGGTVIGCRVTVYPETLIAYREPSR